MRRWRWGRAHLKDRTEIYYQAEPLKGESRSLWITCRDGRPEEIRESIRLESRGAIDRNIFGVVDDRLISVADLGDSNGFDRTLLDCLDDGPFYRRRLARFHPKNGEGEDSIGICEVLQTNNIYRPLFNWMIPFRLKRPSRSHFFGKSVSLKPPA